MLRLPGLLRRVAESYEKNIALHYHPKSPRNPSEPPRDQDRKYRRTGAARARKACFNDSKVLIDNLDRLDLILAILIVPVLAREEGSSVARRLRPLWPAAARR